MNTVGSALEVNTLDRLPKEFGTASEDREAEAKLPLDGKTDAGGLSELKIVAWDPGAVRVINILVVEDPSGTSIVDGSVESVCWEPGDETMVDTLWVAKGSKVLMTIFEVKPPGWVSEVEGDESCNYEETGKDGIVARELELRPSEDPDRVLVCPTGSKDASGKTTKFEVASTEV
jgi:hypothetical protein